MHRDQEMFIIVARSNITVTQNLQKAQTSSKSKPIDSQTELLMPKKFLERDLADLAMDVEDETSINQLARKYRVSLQALAWRISGLFGAA